jgi:hypothetical protein
MPHSHHEDVCLTERSPFACGNEQDKLRQEQLARLKAEEDGKLRLSDCTKHYEGQIRTMRFNHEQVPTALLCPYSMDFLGGSPSVFPCCCDCCVLIMTYSLRATGPGEDPRGTHGDARRRARQLPG